MKGLFVTEQTQVGEDEGRRDEIGQGVPHTRPLKVESLGSQPENAAFGSFRTAVDAAWKEIDQEQIVPRIWMHDHHVWKPSPDEISNRLGWLHTAESMRVAIPRLAELTERVTRNNGKDSYSQALLLGMGGSSLAAGVLATILGTERGLNLAVLDSTDPGAVLEQTARLDPQDTLFVVASKSGTTVETRALFRFFYNWTADQVGPERAGEHFVAVTDPGTPLAELAERFGFRDLFLNDPNIGGRYSALSYFGLVPAALAGVDISRLLDRGRAMMKRCGPCVAAEAHPGSWLGAILGLAGQGVDKATFVLSPPVAPLGSWVEQLLAESTGKEGKGLLPVTGEPLAQPDVYGRDRLFVRIALPGEEVADPAREPSEENLLAQLEVSGHPVVRLHMRDRYDLGARFFLWEMAVAVVGRLLGINPFNQPNVESAKEQARQMVDRYKREGALPAIEPAPVTAASWRDFLSQAEPGDYIALHAYLHPKPETDAALRRLRVTLRDRLWLATTAGYGPRLLHSTGQLYKGDAGNGLFCQITADSDPDAPIPDRAGEAESSLTFGTLEMAQALGDRRAMLDAGRRVIHFHLGKDVRHGLERLAAALEQAEIRAPRPD